MTQEEFSVRHTENREEADRQVRAIREAGADREERLLHLREYVRCRYFLDPEDMTSEDIIVLGNRGTERLADLKRSGVEFRDTSAGCTSVASAVTKKALLVLSLGKALDVHLDPDEVAEAGTLTALSDLLGKALGEKT